MKHLDEGQLQAWLDRPRSGLGSGEARVIEDHLRACEACARRLAELRRLDARADSILSSVDPNDGSLPPFGEVEARSHRGGRHRRPRRRWVPLAWAASFVVALGAGWLTNDLRRGRDVAVESGPSEPAQLEAPSDTEGALEPGVVRGRMTNEESDPLPLAGEAPSAGDAPSTTNAPSAARAPSAGDAPSTTSAPSAADALRARAPRPAREASAGGEGSAAWRPVTRAVAGEEAGFEVLAVPGLEIVAVEIGALESAPAVRVRQALGPGTVLTLVQRRGEGATPAADQPDGMATESARRGDLLLTATAPIPADSLQRLLGRIPR